MFRDDRLNHMEERDRLVAKDQKESEDLEKLDKTILFCFDNTDKSAVKRWRRE